MFGMMVDISLKLYFGPSLPCDMTLMSRSGTFNYQLKINFAFKFING